MHQVFFGRGDGIRTHDFFVPNEARYQTALHPDIKFIYSNARTTPFEKFMEYIRT